jgi:hypothetical protein
MGTMVNDIQEVINNSYGKSLTEGKFMQLKLLMIIKSEMLCELFIRI